jgi:hypothetical protein
MRKANFHSNARASWNNRAGTNRNSRDVRGKHTENPGYKPGDNWIECQRCGFDVYASEAREDGYREGLIVCPKCYDAPHPQDYVRAFDDTLTPYGFATGAVEYNRTGAVGSTTSPAQTGFTGDDFTGSLSAIADQISAELETISTLTVTTNFPTAVFDTLLGGDQSVTGWSASGLPSGLTINSSGQITGTVDGDAFDATPYTVLVTATYANGYNITNVPFEWGITETALNPNEVAASCGATDWAWYDASINDDLYTTIAGSTNAASSIIVNRWEDKSGNHHHLYASVDSGNDTWQMTGLDGWGTLQGVSQGNLLSTNHAENTAAQKLIADGADAWSFWVIIRLDGTSGSAAQFGGSGGAGGAATWMFAPGNADKANGYRVDSNTQAGPVRCRINTSAGGIPAHTGVVNRYFHIFFEVSTTACTVYVDNVDQTAAGGTWPNGNGCGIFEMCGNLALGQTNAKFIEVGFFDCQPSTAERTKLWDYHNNRYGLDGQ